MARTAAGFAGHAFNLDSGGDIYHDRYQVKPMPAPQKTRVFRNGRSQAVHIPVDYRFSTDEVYIRRDEQTGDLILSQHAPSSWDKVFAILDEAGFPGDFMSEREQGTAEVREPL
jgi:antitoxin VapB